MRVARTNDTHVVFIPWLVDVLEDARQSLAQKMDPALRHARDAELNAHHEALFVHMRDELGYRSPRGLRATCAISGGEHPRHEKPASHGPRAVLMDVYTGLPARWGAAARWWVLPQARAINECLRMQFCNGQAKASYGDDQAWMLGEGAFHHDTLNGSRTLAMADMREFADV
jgi:hypothetical protein